MNFYLKSVLFIGIFTVLGYFLHQFINPNTAISLIKIYSFLGIATFLTVLALRFVQLYVPDNLGYAFLALVFLKLGAVIFIFPEIISDAPKLSKVQLLHFLAPYAIFLITEATIVIKWLNKN